MAIGSEKARSRNSLVFLRLFEDFGRVGGLLGELFGLLVLSRSGLGASWTIFGAILRHIRLS
jgi:hypothetical protein